MEILRITEHNSADLIVIATHGMTGWHRLVFGSVAEKVVRLASCPVLVLRANPKAGQDASLKSADAAAVSR
jgi:nucleotide-binding universal stress UspA family protein